ncbi:hypothetical protein ABW20_dc0108111 [Dactylellina cionopaga]|nr:hypothetical protein ABW20_dc0108111 [Dactylellina cionopaga]
MSELPTNPVNLRFVGADGYEKLTGGWPARVAKNIISNLDAPIDANSIILDNCCGSGAITTAIINYAEERGFAPQIRATDISPGMIEHVSSLPGKPSTVQTQIMDAQDLKFPDNTFSHVFCAFGVFFCPDYELGYREMYRVAAPGSVTVITSWKYVGWLPMVNYVIKQIRPEQEEWQFPAASGFRDAAWVKERAENAGWKDVTVREIEDYTAATKETARALLPVMKEAVDGWSDGEKEKWVELFDEAAVACGVKKTSDGQTWDVRMIALEVTGRK